MSYYYDGYRNKIEYKTIANTIRKLHPYLRGKHIFTQLVALGLYEGFNRGSTPCSLPFSFTEYEDHSCPNT